jgi:hypothetical protein
MRADAVPPPGAGPVAVEELGQGCDELFVPDEFGFDTDQGGAKDGFLDAVPLERELRGDARGCPVTRRAVAATFFAGEHLWLVLSCAGPT